MTPPALLFACMAAVPLLHQGEGSLGQWCGLIGIGVGDAVAGAIGSSYGRTRWPLSRKTVIGTCSGMCSMVVAALCVAILAPNSVGAGWGGMWNTLEHIFSRAFFSRHNVAMLFSMLAGAGIETSTDALDNLVLPLWMVVVAAAAYD